MKPRKWRSWTAYWLSTSLGLAIIYYGGGFVFNSVQEWMLMRSELTRTLGISPSQIHDYPAAAAWAADQELKELAAKSRIQHEKAGDLAKERETYRNANVKDESSDFQKNKEMANLKGHEAWKKDIGLYNEFLLAWRSARYWKVRGINADPDYYFYFGTSTK